MQPQNLNTPTYAIAIDATSKEATLKTTGQGFNANAIIYNDSDNAVFVVAGQTSTTAVFPTSDITPLAGKVIGAKSTMVYALNPDDRFVAAVQLIAGTGNLYISIGDNV